MSDETLIRAIRELVWVQLAERQRHMRAEGEEFNEKTSSRGMFSYYELRKEVRRLCENELQVRGKLIVEQMVRAIQTLDVEASSNLAEFLKEELHMHLIQEVPKLEAFLAEVSPRVFATVDTSLAEAAQLTLKKAKVEIDLFVATLKGRGSQGPTREPVMTIYGTVGAVQTGPGATAHITQIITPDDRQRLFEALERVKEQVESRGEVEEYSRKDLIAVIDDARSDASKEQPNMLRLRSLSSTIATTIQTVAALRPAYEFLKGALLPWGVVLP